MGSTSALMLMLSVLLLEVLHSAHCRSIGELCDTSTPNQCDPGLICAADTANPDIAYCRHSNSEPCNLANCPSLVCDVGLQYTPAGQCCPLCLPPPTVVHISGCTEENGNHYNEGESWQRDSCTSCTCTNDFSLCSAISCDLLTCTNYVELPGQCCPVCVETSGDLPPLVTVDCRVGDTVYSDGEIWKPDRTDPCRHAVCDEGEVFYFYHHCAAPECENPIFSDDTCCPTCPEEELTQITPSLETLPALTACSYNGITLQEGETHCPAPNTTITCLSGELEYSSHCDPVPCSNPIAGINACDCPFCPEDMQQFVVGGLLDMPIYQFAFQASQTDKMLKNLVLESGLTPEYNQFRPCNLKVCVEMHVLTSDANATEDEVVEAVRNEMDSEQHNGLSIGHVGDFATERRSARSVDHIRSLNSDHLTHSSSSDQHDSATATATALIACVGGVIACVVGVALLASFVRRKKNSQKTIIV